MTKPKKTVLLSIGKLLAVTITLSVAFSFGWYQTQNYFNATTGPDMDSLSTYTHIDTMVVPQTVVFYDTIGVYKVYTDTMVVEPPIEDLPPRPWGTLGRP